MSPQVVLITGANRGIGFALLQLYAADSNNVIYAGVRDPAKATEVKSLAETSKAKIHVLEITSADEAGNKKAAEVVKAESGHVDVIIANAGISQGYTAIVDTPIAVFDEHYKVNTLGPVILYQAFHSLLFSSPLAEPKFIVLSTAAGSIQLAPTIPFPVGAYGSSKAGLNFVLAKLSLETAERGINVIPVHPGMVSSDMGAAAFTAMGFTEAPPGLPVLTPDESATALKKVFDGATRETTGGKFLNYDGTELPW